MFFCTVLYQTQLCSINVSHNWQFPKILLLPLWLQLWLRAGGAQEPHKNWTIFPFNLQMRILNAYHQFTWSNDWVQVSFKGMVCAWLPNLHAMEVRKWKEWKPVHLQKHQVHPWRPWHLHAPANQLVWAPPFCEATVTVTLYPALHVPDLSVQTTFRYLRTA